MEAIQPSSFATSRVRLPLQMQQKKQEIEINSLLHKELQQFCEVLGVSPFTVLHTAFRTTHFRLTGADDATVGTQTTNQDCEKLDGSQGSFPIMQCIRIHVGDETSFEELVQQVDKTITEANANREISIESILSELQRKGTDRTHTPVVRMKVSLQSQQNHTKTPVLENSNTNQLSIVGNSRLDLEVHLYQEVDRLHGTILYGTDLFHKRTISEMIAVFYEVLKQGLKEPQTPVASLRLYRWHQHAT